MRFSSRSKKKLSTMTPLDAARESKLRMEDQAERIDILGQSSDTGAVKWVQEDQKEYEKKEKNREEIDLYQLQNARKRILSYRGILILLLNRLCQEWQTELPKGYNWTPRLTKKGVILIFRTSRGEYFARGMKISAEPKFDLNGLHKLIGTALQKIDVMEETRRKFLLP